MAMALPRGAFPRSRTYSFNFNTYSSMPNLVSPIEHIEGPSPGLWTLNSPTFGIHVTGSPWSHAGHGSCWRPTLRSMDFYWNVQLSRLYARYIMPPCVSSFHCLERALAGGSHPLRTWNLQTADDPQLESGPLLTDLPLAGFTPWTHTMDLRHTADYHSKGFTPIRLQCPLRPMGFTHAIGFTPWTLTMDLHRSATHCKRGFTPIPLHNQCNHFRPAHHIAHINSGGITNKPTNSLDNPPMMRDDCPGKLIQRYSS